MSIYSDSECQVLPKTVVENFGGARVSWAPLYIRNAQRAGFDILPTTTSETEGHKIFLGDVLPEHMGRGGMNLYFLAAAEGTADEGVSARRADITTTVSQAEKTRLLRAFPEVSEDRVVVDGFPVYDEEAYAALGRVLGVADRKGVAFVGRVDADKGPQLELRIAEAFRHADIPVAHLSAEKNPLKDDLTRLGVDVREAMAGDAYLRALGSYHAVINTSPRESLYVSGIEASALGVPVFAPDVDDNGIRDWNLSDRFYDPRNVNELIERVQSVDVTRVPDVSRYDARAYFERLARYMEAGRE